MKKSSHSIAVKVKYETTVAFRCITAYLSCSWLSGFLAINQQKNYIDIRNQHITNKITTTVSSETRLQTLVNTRTGFPQEYITLTIFC